MDNVLKQGITRARLINYLLLMFIIFTFIFGILYFFALSPDKILYSIVPATASKNKPPNFKFAFYGEGENKIQKPMDLAIKGDKVFVSDAYANKIWVFDLNGRFKYGFGRQGTGEGEFNFPYGIAVDNRDRVMVADMKNNRVQVFNTQGKFLSYFPANATKDNFKSPGAVSVVNNLVYITDIYKNKILVYDLQGKKILEFGGNGMEQGQFKYPNGVTADSDGNIYVADSGNNRVQIFKKDGSFNREVTGSHIDSIETRFASPRGIAVSGDFLFVVNSMSSQIWTSSLKGQLYYRFGEKGEDNNQFNFPNGLEINKNLIYITDGENHGIKVYSF